MVTKKKVLIIDDEEDACLLLKTFFLKKDCEVYCSYTLNEGLRQVKALRPDMLFLDNNLPDGFGWEAYPAILEQHPDVDLHLITAYNNSNFDLHQLKASVNVWQKPISFKKLNEQLFVKPTR